MASPFGFAKLQTQIPPPKQQIDFWSNGPTVILEGPDISPSSPEGLGEGPPFLDNPWDVVFFNDDPLPGKWTVTGLPTLAVDRKKHAGVDGAIIVVNGYIPGPIELEGLIWTQAQWEHFQVLAPSIWRKPLKKAKLSDLAVTIGHPALALWGITKGVVVGVSPPLDGPIRQSKTIKIKLLEFVQPDGVTVTKTAKQAPIAPLDTHFQAKNNPSGKPPSQTDTGVHGAAIDHRGGSD